MKRFIQNSVNLKCLREEIEKSHAIMMNICMPNGIPSNVFSEKLNIFAEFFHDLINQLDLILPFYNLQECSFGSDKI